MNVGQSNAAFRLRRWLLGDDVTDQQALDALTELLDGAGKRLLLSPDHAETARAIDTIRALREEASR